MMCIELIAVAFWIIGLCMFPLLCLAFLKSKWFFRVNSKSAIVIRILASVWLSGALLITFYAMQIYIGLGMWTVAVEPWQKVFMGFYSPLFIIADSWVRNNELLGFLIYHIIVALLFFILLQFVPKKNT